MAGFKCPSCGAELEVILTAVEEPVIEKEPRIFPPVPAVKEIHTKEENRWAVRVIKDSREDLFYAGALIKGAFGCHGVVVSTTVGVYRVFEWAKITNRAGRSVLLDVWR